MSEHPGSQWQYRKGCRCDNCTAVEAERRKTYRDAHKREIAEYNRAYREAHPGYNTGLEQNAQQRARYADNPEPKKASAPVPTTGGASKRDAPHNVPATTDARRSNRMARRKREPLDALGKPLDPGITLRVSGWSF